MTSKYTRLRADYGLLNETKVGLEALANDITPTMNNAAFKQSTTAMYGSLDMASAMNALHNDASYTMKQAEKKIKQLAASFGSVGELFARFDSEMALGMMASGATTAVQNYFEQKKQWDYYQDHKSECDVPDKDKPGFCSATDPGDEPPLHQTTTGNTGGAKIYTDVVLGDDKKTVVKETTTVEFDGKTYTSTTAYSNDGHHMVTDSKSPDGSTSHTVVDISADGSGTSKTTSDDGKWSEYTRGPTPKDKPPLDWEETAASREANAPKSPGEVEDDTPPPKGPSGAGPKIN
ncbi:hypothetical protein OG474_18360 [Kribbella sp. NBC_01505]|uniref:hypothetical protein n=1 Tax=Kribbella sp. NBC_01505 TaxID=2903580 RepID=UPI00386BC737